MTIPMVLRAERARDPATEQQQLKLLGVLFFFSGFPALIYQLVWQRALFRIFGVNIESVTIVVTAFMLGLGLGSLFGGWISKRERIPLLLLLALIEALTGAFGLVSLSIFESVGDWISGASLPMTALATMALVIVPTLLMGATLPLLVAHLVRRSHRVGSAVGQLYYVNTLGAGAACLVCACVLFPWIGMRATVLYATAFNALVAIGAIAMHLSHPGQLATMASTRFIPAPSARRTGLSFAVVLALSCANGFVSLSYEIFFFRTMSFASGSSAFAFATTLGAFLIGLASGSRVGGESCRALDGDALVRRILRNVLLASLIGFAALPLLSHFAWLDRALLGVGLLLVYLLARQWGAVLPCLAQLGVSADGRAGMQTGLLYFANIVGAASGSILTGFILMDHFGLVAVAQLLVAAGLACSAVLVCVMHGSRRTRLAWIASLVLGGGATVMLLPMAAGHVLEALQWKGEPNAAQPFAAVVENRSGIISVDRTGTVYGNGAYDGHFNVDLTRDVNGIIRPFALSLFHPAPRDVLMIGLSTGSWAQVIANNPEVRSLTVVEINPGYLALIASEPSVASVLSNPKVIIIADDGRRWLRMHPERHFDAIVSNTTYHFRANATNLLSTEFLEALKPHLNPGGIVFYNTTDSRRVQRTGCASFGHGARFTNHVVLSSTPIDWDFARWRRVLVSYRIDGRPVLDLSQPEHVEGLRKLMDLERETARDAPGSKGDFIEPCGRIMDATAGKALVTDDNMGAEWRHGWLED